MPLQVIGTEWTEPIDPELIKNTHIHRRALVTNADKNLSGAFVCEHLHSMWKKNWAGRES